MSTETIPDILDIYYDLYSPKKGLHNTDQDGTNFIESNRRETINKIENNFETSVGILNEIKLREILSEVYRNENVTLAVVNIPYDDAYINLRIENAKKAKEGEIKMDKIQAKLRLYKYYAFVWILSALLLGAFAAIGAANILPPLPSITGVLFSIGGMFGAYLDWKDKEKRLDV